MDIEAINAHVQQQLRVRGLAEIPAVEAARWLDQAGLLRDSPDRPGLPLRELLRAGLIEGQRQEANHRWFIDRTDISPHAVRELASPFARSAHISPDLGTKSSVSVDWDPRQKNSFGERQFSGFLALGDLVANRTSFLNEATELQHPGVYAVFAPRGWEPDFVTSGLNNVIRPWPEDRLRSRWIIGVDLVYVGCASATPSSRTLRKRLGDLLNHGAGLITASGPHKGGERLWQCVGWESFTLAWKATGPYPAPHDLEVAIRMRFAELAGGLPFANVRL